MMIEILYSEVSNQSYTLFKYCLSEMRCSLKKEIWVSKYNSYVEYDYEPFCSEGFELRLTVEAPSEAHVRFFEQFYNKMAKDVNYLENCLIEERKNDSIMLEDETENKQVNTEIKGTKEFKPDEE